MKKIRIPCIVSVETAVRIHNEKPRLRNGDIMELFGCGLSKARQLREYVNAYLIEKDCPVTGDATVETEDAYLAWGLDIDALRARLDQILKYRKKVAG